jgi:hypothetical protein
MCSSVKRYVCAGSEGKKIKTQQYQCLFVK